METLADLVVKTSELAGIVPNGLCITTISDKKRQ